MTSRATDIASCGMPGWPKPTKNISLHMNTGYIALALSSTIVSLVRKTSNSNTSNFYRKTLHMKLTSNSINVGYSSDDQTNMVA